MSARRPPVSSRGYHEHLHVAAGEIPARFFSRLPLSGSCRDQMVISEAQAVESHEPASLGRWVDVGVLRAKCDAERLYYVLVATRFCVGDDVSLAVEMADERGQ